MAHAEAARKLDVATKSLREWKEQHERGELKASLGISKLTVDQQRIRELECELAIAKMERDWSCPDLTDSLEILDLDCILH